MRIALSCLLLVTAACNKEGKPAGETGDKAADPAPAAATETGGKAPEGKEGAAVAGDAEQKPVPTSKEEQEEVEDQAIGAKLNPYIDCLNAFSNKVYEARDRYFSWVDQKKGLTGKESPKYGTFTLTPTDECEKGIEAVKSANPDLPDLEKAGDAYVALLKQLHPLQQQIYDYYENRDYSDDKMAKGFEMDKQVTELWKQFATADQDLRGQIVKINDAVQERGLARLEKTDGRKLPFLHGTLMAKAKALIALGSVKSPADLPLPEFTAALEALTAAQKEFVDYGTAHADEAGQWSGMAKLLSATEEFHQTGKELMRRKRDNEKYTPGEKKDFEYGQAANVDGSPEKLVKTYNDLVEASNNAH